MHCKHCASAKTRVISTDHHDHGTKRYHRCLDCGEKFRTLQSYDPKPRTGKPYIGTPREHTIARGEDHGSAVLTVDNIREIRRLCDEGASYTQLAKRFGMSRTHISDIHRRKCWAHVDAELYPRGNLKQDLARLRADLDSLLCHPLVRHEDDLLTNTKAAMQALHRACRAL